MPDVSTTPPKFFRKTWFWFVLIAAGAGIFRRVTLIHVEMPTGDEINTYIRYAQEVLKTGDVPPVFQHPLVALVYAGLIGILRSLGYTLAGPLATYVVSIVSGMVGAGAVFEGLRRSQGVAVAGVAAVAYACNPALLAYPPRGDLNLFLMLVPWAIVLMKKGIEHHSWRLSAAAGCALGLTWLSRSDGMAFSLALLFVVAVLYKAAWRQWLTALLFVALMIGGYRGLFRIQTGGWGAGSSQRAWDAFYQAEGLHDGKKGSWQDYTERGLQRFGEPGTYDNSFARMLWVNRSAVSDRIKTNLRLFLVYHRAAYGFSAWLAIALMAGCFFTRRNRVLFYLWFVPVSLACLPQLLFYAQRPYYVLGSGVWALCVFLGLLGWGERFLLRSPGLGTRETGRAVVVALCLVVPTVIAWRVSRLLPRRESRLGWQRMAPILGELEKLTRGGASRFIAPGFGGSNSIYLYVDRPAPEGGYELLTAADPAGRLENLRSSRIRYVVALRERREAWRLSGRGVSVIKENARRDARILEILDVPAEFIKRGETQAAVDHRGD